MSKNPFKKILEEERVRKSITLAKEFLMSPYNIIADGTPPPTFPIFTAGEDLDACQLACQIKDKVN